MRRATRLSAALLLLVLVACSANPTNRWAQARSMLTTAQDTVIIAHTAGFVTDETLVASEPIVVAGRAALGKAETYLPEGGDSFEQYMGILDAMLARLELMAISGDLELGGD